MTGQLSALERELLQLVETMHASMIASQGNGDALLKHLRDLEHALRDIEREQQHSMNDLDRRLSVLERRLSAG